jgi:hypothetical protein
MTAQRRDNFIEGFNYYVPAMQAGGDLGQLTKIRVNLGAIVLADADGILDGADNSVVGDITTLNALYSPAKMGKFGRNVTVVASGAATSVVTVIGRDYLGQPMRENLTLNGTTPVVGLKAFKYIDKVNIPVGTASTTIDLGWGARMGLPYKTRAIYREYEDQVVAAAGTLNAPVITDPQTATTGDPRGTYTPTGTPNGTKVFEVDAEIDASVNAAGNGGLHGIRHFNN